MNTKTLSDQHLLESCLDSQEVFSGRLLKVHADRVRLPDGQEAVREYIRHPGAVVMLAVLDNGKLLFERQFRYPVGQVFLELPAGKIDAGEPALDTARRELREETGYKAKHWRHLGTMHPCIGYADEHIEIFLAHGLSFIGPARDQGEFLEVIELSLSDAVLAVRDGDITDAKTITALFWAEKIYTGEWSLDG
ncbi:MAG: NUDIX hydrolase [Sterolibacterium sp.]|nr:NUDIX hydrolase [Sterolibacterium sp.]